MSNQEFLPGDKVRLSDSQFSDYPSYIFVGYVPASNPVMCNLKMVKNAPGIIAASELELVYGRHPTTKRIIVVTPELPND